MAKNRPTFVSKTHDMNAAIAVVSKEAVLQSISKMPDQIPLETLLDEIIYLYKVQAALLRSENGEGITIEAFRQKVGTWVK